MVWQVVKYATSWFLPCGEWIFTPKLLGFLLNIFICVFWQTILEKTKYKNAFLILPPPWFLFDLSSSRRMKVKFQVSLPDKNHVETNFWKQRIFFSISSTLCGSFFYYWKKVTRFEIKYIKERGRKKKFCQHGWSSIFHVAQMRILMCF